MLTMKEHTLSYLKQCQNEDGGWGYSSNGLSVVEATSAVLMAMRSWESCVEHYRRGFMWLRSAQNRDGGWGVTVEDPDSGWQSSWAVLALSSSDDPGLGGGIKWLQTVEPAVDNTDEEDLARINELFSYDPTLKAWPWRPNEASWVEPTALSLLALWSADALSSSTQRVTDALAYLEDRRCQGGGWNVGNPAMFSKPLPALVHPSAWVVIVLSRFMPEMLTSDDINTVRGLALSDNGPLGLALSLLALQETSEDVDTVRQRLLAMQSPDGGWENNPFATAMALMALQGSFI